MQPGYRRCCCAEKFRVAPPYGKPRAKNHIAIPSVLHERQRKRRVNYLHDADDRSGVSCRNRLAFSAHVRHSTGSSMARQQL